jgi:hypothetical protein
MCDELCIEKTDNRQRQTLVLAKIAESNKAEMPKMPPEICLGVSRQIM